MKLSFVATISAIVLATTSNAENSVLRLFNLENHKGNCRAFPLTAYGDCYTVSEFYLPRSASFHNADTKNDKITLTFFETGNCGGKWTRISGQMSTTTWSSWGRLGSVTGIVGSVMVQNTLTSNDDGTINQYRPAFIAKWQKDC